MKELHSFVKEVIEEEVRSSDYSSTYETAQRVHRDQRRRSGEDYFEHPKEVRNIFRKFYPSDKIGQLAALLHDTLEDYEKGGVYKTEEEVIDQISNSITNHIPREKVIDISGDIGAKKILELNKDKILNLEINDQSITKAFNTQGDFSSL